MTTGTGVRDILTGGGGGAHDETLDDGHGGEGHPDWGVVGALTTRLDDGGGGEGHPDWGVVGALTTRLLTTGTGVWDIPTGGWWGRS